MYSVGVSHSQGCLHAYILVARVKYITSIGSSPLQSPSQRPYSLGNALKQYDAVHYNCAKGARDHYQMLSYLQAHRGYDSSFTTESFIYMLPH